MALALISKLPKLITQKVKTIIFFSHIYAKYVACLYLDYVLFMMYIIKYILLNFLSRVKIKDWIDYVQT